MKTIGAAVSRAQQGQTIVVRAGVYHESINTNKSITIQAYPGEQVWMDGSRAVNNWTAAGNVWRATGWTAKFDSSPTFTRGAKDGTEPKWSFVNPAYPMAAHPDQVWIDGVAQRQVSSLNQVSSGKFYVDYATASLYVGSNPSGRAVRASDISRAIYIAGPNTKLLGFGVRRYAPSVPDMGAVVLKGSGDVVENVAVIDNSTTGLSIGGTNTTVKKTSLLRNGMLGLHANNADNLTLAEVDASANNTEHFNLAPVSGGAKITRTRGVVVRNSAFNDNLSKGLWLDESTYNVAVTGNQILDNSGHGLFLEISARFRVVNNVIGRNGGDGIKVQDTSDVSIWNNTIFQADRPIDVVQDSRRASNYSTPGHDQRQPFPDPTMSWIVGPVTVSNNILASSTGDCVLCVLDYSHQMTAEQMKVRAAGNLYQRQSASSPASLVLWAKGPNGRSAFNTLAAFKSATGQEATGRELVGQSAVGSDGSPKAVVSSQQSKVAMALPSDIAALANLTPGIRVLGAVN